MFYNSVLTNDMQKQQYEKFLKIVGSLSNLFSESEVPFLYYRIAEKIFCKAFEADDLSRSDVSVDVKKGDLGIGLKTFVAGNHRTLQKITEFGSSDKALYESLSLDEKIRKIALIRNERIDFTQRVHGINKSIYHCVIRDKNQFSIFEKNMNFINVEDIKDIKENKGSITFNDGVEEYSFLLSKNTLTKRFNTSNILQQFEIEILENPLDFLVDCMQNISSLAYFKPKETIFLPLYGRNHTVFSKSGLNQWNANGRRRDINEVYIPVPIDVHKKYPNFFPNRETPFNLKLPNGKTIQTKICQDNGKALMSYSNRELGQWILRDVLKLNEGELLTYDKLQVLGIDSVRIDKLNDENYEINFAKNGSYDIFISQSSGLEG
ncbi:restriction endonuclease [Wolinella succinogenes]|uniref:restriction endonuclease n=1 Tax=Wolinella succinogenes TaxID=844 RepID=UPI00240A5968|nr:restriction endonuclease [Wolinella succinogenes]